MTTEFGTALTEKLTAAFRERMTTAFVPGSQPSPEDVKAALLKLWGYDPDAVTVERDAVDPSRVNITMPWPRPLLSLTFPATPEQGERLQAGPAPDAPA